ncbi:Ammonium transporter [Carpediemonas membranifera]|uniref:Ammonium transporter n=1 Tax=Carpediemonas membranifera TaxID=201153 RepID=A0A8J6AYL5_9EUKA|nr:Ammonium transporter [Carpediemonas membranifera]|eukprot:KAG9394620.1 Ammonium transporter [Carpediemonas membranifera]
MTTIAELEAQIVAMKAVSDRNFLLRSAFTVLTMQGGFAALEAGCVRKRNSANIMAKNLTDIGVGAISYWALGYGLSYGIHDGWSNGFAGTADFFISSESEHLAAWVFQFSFAATASTIVSGAWAERTKFSFYVFFSFLLNLFVYPIAAHWIWASDGFFAKDSPNNPFPEGTADFAGGTVVHLLGGTAGLVGTIILKPRHQRFTSDDWDVVDPFQMILGLFVLFWGWYGFNSGSTQGLSGNRDYVAATVCLNTTISAGGALLVSIMFCLIKSRGKVVDIATMVNATLAGLVGITPACAFVSAPASIGIGVITCCTVLTADFLLPKLRIDDPVSAFPVHGVGGITGMLLTGIFAQPDAHNVYNYKGLIHGGGFWLLFMQLTSCLCVIAWTAVCTVLIVLPARLLGMVRVSIADEVRGLDYSEHRVGQSDMEKSVMQRITKYIETITNDKKTMLNPSASGGGLDQMSDFGDNGFTSHFSGSGRPEHVSDAEIARIVQMTHPLHTESIRTFDTIDELELLPGQSEHPSGSSIANGIEFTAASSVLDADESA